MIKSLLDEHLRDCKSNIFCNALDMLTLEFEIQDSPDDSSPVPQSLPVGLAQLMN